MSKTFSEKCNQQSLLLVNKRRQFEEEENREIKLKTQRKRLKRQSTKFREFS